MLTLNKKIIRFANAMQNELDKNSHKGSIFNWNVDIYHKIADFEYHKSKMLLALRTGDKDAFKEYIADCGNILMAIGDSVGIYDTDIVNSETSSELKDIIFNHVSNDSIKRETTFVQIKNT